MTWPSTPSSADVSVCRVSPVPGPSALADGGAQGVVGRGRHFSAVAPHPQVHGHRRRRLEARQAGDA